MMTPILLNEYRRVVFFTGAGMSAESGVPTYRGRGGIWAEYDWEEYACQDAFDTDPRKVLDFHEQRRAKVLACQPHAGHRHLATLQAAHPGVGIVTQNTDGMHQRAGAKSVVELHGSLWRIRCPRHGTMEDLASPAYARRDCPHCGTPLRPDITWFEDPVNAAVFEQARNLITQAELFVAVGTSAIVYPAAGLIPLAKQVGAQMVEVNVDDTEMSRLFLERVREPAGTALPELFLA
ncbi:MAG: NAD-dependent deacylase [Nevskia sp.]|nr:NAD-dependent deacylase [Nevskia sp.]